MTRFTVAEAVLIVFFGWCLVGAVCDLVHRCLREA